MFSTYLLPVKTAVWLFPFVAALVLIPAAIVGYRRRGRAGGWAAVVLYSFVFYLLAALLQTVVPLPRDPEAYCATHTYAATPQLRPFGFVGDIAREAHGSWSPGALLRNPAVWTSALNLVLLLPLGIYLRYYLRRGAAVSTAVAFGVSLFFETTQLTGLWFAYPCAYRLFNVDDLLLNTLGALLGWLLAGPLMRLLPTLDPARERARYAALVTFPRRALAYLTDLAGWLITWTVLTGLLTLVTSAATAERLSFPLGTALGLGWFWVLPALTGATPGKRAVLLRVRHTRGGRAGAGRLAVRFGVLHAPLWIAWLGLWADSERLELPGPARLALPLALIAAVLVAWIWSPLAALLRTDHRTPYEQWSGTVNSAGMRDAVPYGPG